MSQPVGPIPVQRPVPSILTTARDRTSDGFGTQVPLPEGVAEALPEGVNPGRQSWRSGIAWQQFVCQGSYPWPECPPDDQPPREWSDLSGPVSSRPFWVYTPLECEWAGAQSVLPDAARALQEAHTAFGLARALWMGEGLPDAVSQPTLRTAATDTATAADDLDVVVAQLLGRYEQATQGLGGAVLHIPSILMTGALGGLPGGGKVATLEGERYRGPLGSLVSPGPGYPWGASVQGPDGFGPQVGGTDEAPEFAGNAADEVWVYVTGPVEYAAGPVEVEVPATADALRQNTLMVMASRPLVFRFDPCPVFAALANNPYAGGGS